MRARRKDAKEREKKSLSDQAEDLAQEALVAALEQWPHRRSSRDRSSRIRTSDGSEQDHGVRKQQHQPEGSKGVSQTNLDRVGERPIARVSIRLDRYFYRQLFRGRKR
jgi:predicted RNA polymerase sigma factor